jgi:hypothetical protein
MNKNNFKLLGEYLINELSIVKHKINEDDYKFDNEVQEILYFSEKIKHIDWMSIWKELNTNTNINYDRYKEMICEICSE